MKTGKSLAIIFFAAITTWNGNAQNLKLTGSALINFNVLDSHSYYSNEERGYIPDSACFVGGIPHPNRFLTQEYGLLPVKKHTIDEIESDFIGLGITEREKTQHHVRIISNKGWDVTFESNAQNAYGIDVINVEFNAESFFEIQQMSLAWRKELAKRGLTKSYLINNPYYADELYIASKISPTANTESVIADPTGDNYASQKNAIMLIPNMESYGQQFNDSLISWISTMRPDWFATTIFDLNIQEELDMAMHSGKNDNELNNELARHFVFTEKEDLKKTNTFKLIRTLAKLGIRIICLGNEDNSNYRTNLTSYGDAIRNMHWASKIPTSGRGMLLIKPSSICINHPYNIQDFIKVITPDYLLYSLGEFVYFRASDLNARNLSPKYSDEGEEQTFMPYQMPSKKN